MDLNIDCHRTAPWANLFTVLSLGLGTRPFASGGRSDRRAHAGGCSAEAGSGGDGWECHVGRRRKRVVAAGAAARLAPAAMSASPDAAGTPPLPQAAATPSGGCVQRLAPRFPCPPASLGRCSTCRALLWEPGEPMAVPAGASTAQPCCWLARSCSCDRSWASGLLCPLAKWSRCLQRQRLSLSPQAGPKTLCYSHPAMIGFRGPTVRLPLLACVGLKSGKARTSLQHRLPAETGREPGESRESNKTGVEQGDMQRKQLTGHASKRVYDWQSGMAHWGETQRYGSMGWPNGSAER